MKVINLNEERSKRSRYKNLVGPVLWESLVSFLEANPPPLRNSHVIRQGILLFEQGVISANTSDMREVCMNYLKMYKGMLK